jgi:hypothetical protein
MENIQKHIDYDKKILDDSTISPQHRRHTKEELISLQKYHENHPEDDHDPSPLELYCEDNPAALECRIYED